METKNLCKLFFQQWAVIDAGFVMLMCKQSFFMRG